MDYVIKESDDRSSEFIVDNLVEYNLSKVKLTQKEPFIWINRIIEDTNGNIVAGIISKMYCWNCLYIDSLWVKEEHRKNGFGSQLLREVEKTAIENNCSLIHLDTFDFQALDFYTNHGYSVFGILEDCPNGHKRYFMKKNI
ncbi:GNAT family N-acetyltransferase [Clostridium sp. 19966]|uniref:GNAT family N-acetyltransferase n=1 Tax=Clostridium sp. 19966 TaxID=2768166 RepID=UPI0028E09271|nr:GNAT family N-acetyltransferase [Clostridium sp. 19966]MDT8719748.1 GNAT family N-acetyltransferase [Clostridium sp. 19966]